MNQPSLIDTDPPAQPFDTEAFVRGGKVSKVDRYKWAAIDKPGNFEWIPKDQLRVDQTYQREECERKIKRIAANWSWAICGCISVAKRGKVLYVFDGSHRTMAARRRADVENLPCIVFDFSGVEEEALAFLGINRDRAAVTAIDKYRAMNTAKDPLSMAVRDLIQDAGYSVSRSTQGRTLKCIGTAMALYQTDKEVFLRVWSLALAACDGGPIHQRILESLFWIESRLPNPEHPQFESLTHSPWRERVVKLGSDGILTVCRKWSGAMGKGGATVWGTGVVEALNKGVRNILVV